MKSYFQTLVEQEVKMTLKEAKSAWKRNTKNTGTRMQNIGAAPDHYRGWSWTPPGANEPMVYLVHTLYTVSQPSNRRPCLEGKAKVSLNA